jgi:class 3 adenylate cyclase/Tfp pilus assembly protein PilF
MTSRAYEEIRADISAASSVNDARALRALAEEMMSLGTGIAVASAMNTNATADLLIGDYPAALEHYKQALALREEQGDLAGIAAVKSNIGLVFYNSGDYPLALEHYKQALALFEELGNRIGVANVIVCMGTLASSVGDFPAALEHARRALEVFEQLGNIAGTAMVTGNMGNALIGTGDYATAMEQFQRALTLEEELGNAEGVARNTLGIGNVYYRTGDYPSAMQYYQRALGLYDELGRRAGAAKALGNIGSVYNLIGDQVSAIEFYKRALSLSEDLGDRDGIATLTADIGQVSCSASDYLTGLEFFRRSLAIHEESGNLRGIAFITGAIISTHLYLGEYDDAAQLLEDQSAMLMNDPVILLRHEENRARLELHRQDAESARDHLMKALEIANEFGMRTESADLNRHLRDLAQKRNDFAGYIEHNNEYQRITEEIRGQEATRKLAMLEAEKRIEAERAEKEKHRALLHNTLPPAIAERVLRGETVNDSFESAAVMFMDMVGFTTMSASMDPNDVVRLLSDIFTACDAIMAQHGLMKIKTIGDSYMAVAFSNTENQIPNTKHVVSAANAAVDVLRTLSAAHPDIRVRIGLHCGPVTAGVIGTERMQYDVWGDTVNVASRMESHGEPGRVHVSESFALALDPGFKPENRGRRTENVRHPGESWDPDSTVNKESMTPDSMTLQERGVIDIKGKGPMTTYWLT